ncbi:TetR/AcrR family transcriptional regulator [Salinispirillum sp. LH 10-3-1]|uniref:TetR/AcrR family transcriptional regulator n=1 Tax=Salinispirillum sp. LH 10-3-1 TaxID=2952525 RepID=A0AB38YIG8_9GAMM
MARASKRDHIVAEATGLFLNQGFKGTSIDLVVSTCAVSKPTVYNHFPDKAVLMAAVIDDWLAQRHITPPPALDEETILDHLQANWWTPDHMAMYRLIIAEGWRFADAAQRFWADFHQPWQNAAEDWLQTLQGHSASEAKQCLEAALWQRLMALAKERI